VSELPEIERNFISKNYTHYSTEDLTHCLATFYEALRGRVEGLEVPDVSLGDSRGSPLNKRVLRYSAHKCPFSLKYWTNTTRRRYRRGTEMVDLTRASRKFESPDQIDYFRPGPFFVFDPKVSWKHYVYERVLSVLRYSKVAALLNPMEALASVSVGRVSLPPQAIVQILYSATHFFGFRFCPQQNDWDTDHRLMWLFAEQVATTCELKVRVMPRLQDTRRKLTEAQRREKALALVKEGHATRQAGWKSGALEEKAREYQRLWATRYRQWEEAKELGAAVGDPPLKASVILRALADEMEAKDG